jgi:superoxide dismutase
MILQQTLFPYNISDLKPVINEVGFDQHFNTVYKGYIEDFNNSKGDIPFNKAGAYLHGRYFDNIREYREKNEPTGKVEHIIINRYGSYKNFQVTILDQATRLQGNGWLWMNHAGYVNIIPNNRIVNDIVLLIDLWEHAYVFTHGINKEQYLKTHMHIINWDAVNSRLVQDSD